MTDRLDRIEATLESLAEQGKATDQRLNQVASGLQETRAIADSNAKAILALSESVTDTNRAMATLRTAVSEINTATNARIDRLAQLMEHYFNYQAGTNQVFINGLERLEVVERRLGIEPPIPPEQG